MPCAYYFDVPSRFPDFRATRTPHAGSIRAERVTMNAARPADILRHLEQSGAADADLLARFAASKDATAFAELVRRHAPLVLGVCRRVTGHAQDAEDAFQATFVVLSQKAGSLRNAALLGNWLYGVAYKVAWRAKRAAARRRAREVTMSALPEPAAPPSPLASDVQPILDEELAALPAHYRDAIILCDLRGVSREEAVAALGIPSGTLSSRLANGRKKLAARLTRRGVALTAGALPLAISTAQAATTVSNELVTKTCVLVADFAAGGAVPLPLAHLLEGGFLVRKTLVFGVLMLATVAGAVYAARPDEAPAPAPPKPPVVAEKPDAVPKPKPDEKPGDKPAFTTAPRLQRSFDVPLHSFLTLRWNADGTHLAIAGNESPDVKAYSGGLRLIPLDRIKGLRQTALRKGTQLVAVMPDGNGVVTDLREYDLISGHHQLDFWDRRQPFKGAETRPMAGVLGIGQTVKLELPETHGYAFAPDMKTFRTVAWFRVATGAVEKIEVLEVDAATGKATKTLIKLDYEQHLLSPNGKRLAVLNTDATKVTVYSVDGGAKLSEYTFPVEKSSEIPLSVNAQRYMVFSQDGIMLVVSRGMGLVQVLNTNTGKALPKLEGVSTAHVDPDNFAFTADGRLFTATSRRYALIIKKGKGASVVQKMMDSGTFITVWDTQTGKAVKTWKGASGVRVAFNPARPVLAILESNGATNTRVGFWDFSAESEKK